VKRVTGARGKTSSPACPLVLIEWLYSARPDPAWRHLDDLPELKVIRCVSVGWLVGDSAEVTMLAPNVGCVGD